MIKLFNYPFFQKKQKDFYIILIKVLYLNMELISIKILKKLRIENKILYNR